jgi:hypothetical protein
VQFLPAGTISVLIASGATGTCTGCTDSVGSSFATDGVPFWSWTVTDDEFDVSGGTRLMSDASTKVVTCGTGMSCVESGGAVEVSATGSSSAIDFMDMAYWQFHVLPFVIANTGSFVPFFLACEHNDGCGQAETFVAGEPRGYNFFTGTGTPTSGDYALAAISGDASAPSARPRFNDFVGTFKAFEIGAAIRIPSTANTVQRFGIFGTDVDATPADFVGAVYDSAVDGNWRCQICTTAGGCSSSGTTVAASTTKVTIKLAATATGTLTCTINSTAMVHTATFPTFASGTNVAAQVVTLTTASKGIDVFEIKGRVAR